MNNRMIALVKPEKVKPIEHIEYFDNHRLRFYRYPVNQTDERDHRLKGGHRYSVLAIDLANALGYDSSRNLYKLTSEAYLGTIEAEVVVTANNDTVFRECRVVYEKGIYEILNRSTKRKAHQFLSWLLNNEVLNPLGMDQPLLHLEYNGKGFKQRVEDGYVNVGQLCATHDKRFYDWSRLDSATSYLKAVSRSTNIPVGALLECRTGNGTWAHPLVAIEVARWISPEFGVWCNTHIKTLIEEGHTQLPSASQSNEDVKQLLSLFKTQQEQINRIEQQNKLLLANKSIKENIGEVVEQEYPGMVELISGELGLIEEAFKNEIELIFREKSYYTMTELAAIFYQDYDHHRIACKARCNINGLYENLTGDKLVKEFGNYKFNRSNIVFALWRLKSAAKHYGCSDTVFDDLQLKMQKDELEELYDLNIAV